MKIARHAQIIKLINQYDIETQEELAKKLEESGFAVTQATISRDIRQLKLTKVPKENGGKPLCGSAERTVRGWEPLCARVKRRVYFR